MNKFLQLFIIACLNVVSAAAVAESEHKISVEQAKALVMASLSSQQRALPKVEAVPDTSSKSLTFLFFTVTWEGIENGSVVVGNYAVDQYTGDVWSAVASCDEETNGRLRALQAKIRAALHLSRAKYLRLKTKGPLC